MTHEELLKLAEARGLSAAFVPTNEIVFDETFRRYCEENRCGQYDRNHSCPPVCGTPEAMRAQLLRYPEALVVTSVREIVDFNDREFFRCEQLRHNGAMCALTEALHEQNIPGLMCGSSCCMLCEPCLRAEGKPCAHPEKRWSCLSAYCINVSELARAAGMEYSWNQGWLTLYGLIGVEL